MRPPFYGWVVVVACGVACMASFPGNTFGIAFFVPHIQRDLFLSTVEMTLVWGGGVILAACFLPMAGRAVDKWGSLRVLCGCLPALALSTLAMSYVERWWTLLVLIAGLRFFGIGCILVAATAAANRWFVRKRGRVSVALIAFFYSMMALPAVVQALITQSSWRAAYRWIACGIGVLLSCALVFIRDSPDKMGLLPDGDADTAGGGAAVSAAVSGSEVNRSGLGQSPQQTVTECSFTAKEAMRTPIFWVLTLAIFVVEIYWVACNFNILSLFGRASHKAKLADASLLGVLGIASVASALASVVAGSFVEFLQQRRHRRRAAGAAAPHNRGLMLLVAAQLALTAVSSTLVLFVDTLGLAVAWALFFSVMIGIQDVVMLTVFAEIFGNGNVGAIMGVVSAIMTVATALGPFLGAAAISSGALEAFFLPIAIAASVLCLCCFGVRDPPRGSAHHAIELGGQRGGGSRS